MSWPVALPVHLTSALAASSLHNWGLFLSGLTLAAVNILQLQKKIERPDLEPLIHAVRGVGFVLR